MKILISIFLFQSMLFSAVLTMAEGGLYCEEEKYLNRITRDLQTGSRKFFNKYIDEGACGFTNKDTQVTVLKENDGNFKVNMYNTTVYIYKNMDLTGFNKKMTLNYPMNSKVIICKSLDAFIEIYKDMSKKNSKFIIGKKLLDEKTCSPILYQTNIELLGYYPKSAAKIKFIEARFLKSSRLEDIPYFIHKYYVETRLPNVKSLKFVTSPNKKDHTELYEEIDTGEKHLKIFTNRTSFILPGNFVRSVEYADSDNLIIRKVINGKNETWNLNIPSRRETLLKG